MRDELQMTEPIGHIDFTWELQSDNHNRKKNIFSHSHNCAHKVKDNHVYRSQYQEEEYSSVHKHYVLEMLYDNKTQ